MILNGFLSAFFLLYSGIGEIRYFNNPRLIRFKKAADNGVLTLIDNIKKDGITQTERRLDGFWKYAMWTGLLLNGIFQATFNYSSTTLIFTIMLFFLFDISIKSNKDLMKFLRSYKAVSLLPYFIISFGLWLAIYLKIIYSDDVDPLSLRIFKLMDSLMQWIMWAWVLYFGLLALTTLFLWLMHLLKKLLVYLGISTLNFSKWINVTNQPISGLSFLIGVINLVLFVQQLV